MGSGVVNKPLPPFLPYINLKTSVGSFPFLIDTGANINIISSKLANSYKNNKPYPFKVKTLAGIGGIASPEYAININFFEPKIDHSFRFVVHDFHPFFHGIIGTEILYKLNAKICFQNCTITLAKELKILNIPLLQYKSHKQANNASKFRMEHLNPEEFTKLNKIINDNMQVFKDPDSKLTCMTQVNCRIDTTDDKPINQKVYPYPMAYKEEVQNQIETLLSDGIIQPSRSPWTSPVWIVPKKQDASGVKKFRMVIDYREVNKKTLSDRYPMPEIPYILNQLRNQKYFTTLDLASGFHQIKMNPGDIEKTAFSINNGKYEFLRMPFGLKNGPAIFQRAIDDILREFIGKCCYVYMDDVIVCGETLNDHLLNLDTILKKLNNANLKVQLDKSEFLHKEIEFLGHIVTQNGLKPNQKRVESIQKFPEPTNIKQLRGFLGLSGYYRRFIKDFATIAKPLTNLLRGERNKESKKKISLNKNEREAFQKLKNTLSSSDVLIYPNYDKPFILTTDASNIAIGAVLSQLVDNNDKPIHFASRTLSQTEENYSASEKEMLAIIWALKVFRNYIYGQKFKIITDHQPLTFSLSNKNINPKLKRWKAYLEEHDYEIIYKPGKTNVVADALSRLALTSETIPQLAFHIEQTKAPINAFKNQIIIKISSIEKETSYIPHKGYSKVTIEGPKFSEASILRILKNYLNPNCLNGIHATDSLKLLIQRTYEKCFSKSLRIRFTNNMLEDINLPEDQINIIKKIHFRAHRGIEENKNRILRVYYFPCIRKKLSEFISTCDTCNELKYDRNPIKCPIERTPIPKNPFELCHTDIYSIDNRSFLTYIDKFSKFAFVKVLESKSAENIFKALEECLVNNIAPKILVVDNEKGFNSERCKQLYANYNIEIYKTPTSRSEVNGVVERFHSTLTELYRITKREHLSMAANDIIQLAVNKYNDSIHSATQYSPNEILFNSPPLKNIPKNELYKIIIANLEKAQNNMLKYHNANKKPLPKLNKNQELYENTKRRTKVAQKYKKVKVKIINKNTFIDTNKRKVHLNNIKKHLM